MPIPKIEPGGPVLRLRILWRPGEWAIVKRIKLPRKTLPTHRQRPNLPPGIELAGFWYEAATDEGAVIYRWVMPNPIAPYAEVVDDKGNPSQIEFSRPEVLFDVMIPDLPEVVELRIFSNPDPFIKNRNPYGRDQIPTVVFNLKEEEPHG